MSSKNDENNDNPIVAICYDFDKTLSPDDMQAQGFIQAVGYDVQTFWKKSNDLAKQNGMDQNLAYMYTMLKTAIGKTQVTKKSLKDYGAKVELFPGVKEWFSRIRDFGKENNVTVEHYIISSGLKEMIEGNCIANEFTRIYASSFFFEDDIAMWPAQTVNYTNKTQFLFRIEKGTLDVNDQDVNKKFSNSEIRIPFRNMIYIGDSDTDIPCMKLINTNGGHSIGVYDKSTMDKTKVYRMMRDDRIRYFASADYSENSELDKLVKQIILRTKENEKLESIHIENLQEQMDYDSGLDENKKHKQDLILALECSSSFAKTHDVISDLRKIQDWDSNEIESLFRIGHLNSQVSAILDDDDVKLFFSNLLDSKECDKTRKYAKRIIDDMNESEN
ncbi:haloacid dehalogenase-like hydrolase [Fibrobacter sp. UWB13]|uniref:haloacid dehalogenase-like hydrolase n=1 Tax=Fibrobacter sp. UWB13 TaxID=1896204 RepID=UPI000A09F1C5|nr:haloacid dehalogenase-like hydrolase [Fibrobacter sp. UWB13]SMG12412.1 haloacid dehalogenase-like hydrolase [Fibrobacter sp. UWB13]